MLQVQVPTSWLDKILLEGAYLLNEVADYVLFDPCEPNLSAHNLLLLRLAKLSGTSITYNLAEELGPVKDPKAFILLVKNF